MEFFFAAFFLDQEGMEKTREFMEGLRLGSEIIQNKDNHDQEKVEEEYTNLVYEQKEEVIEEGEIIATENRDITNDGSKEIKEEGASDENIKMKASRICNCDINWKSKKEKRDHFKIVHKKYFNCETCKKVFKKEEDYFSHIKKHANKIKSDSNICEECGFVGKDKYSVKSHRNFHHDATVLICDICSRDFQGHLKLKIHRQRFHGSSKQCKDCGGMFKNLLKHMRTMHTTDDDKKYQCDECGKGFIDKTRLGSHILSLHTNEKPFVCRFMCGFACSSSGNRTKHETARHATKQSLDKLFPEN